MADKRGPTEYWQGQCILAPQPRGFHLITQEIIQAMTAMPAIQTGLVHLFLQHTSASLVISENTCLDVPLDLETYFNKMVIEEDALYRHVLEGSDDMPAHIKNVVLGVSLTLPLQNRLLCLGQWQGIYLCEHRNHGGARRIVITAHGSAPP